MQIKLKELREKAGLSQDQLGKIVGVSQRTIGYYEQGLRVPPLTIAGRIAAQLNCTIDDLLVKEEC